MGEALIWLNHFEGSARPVVLRADSLYAERITTGQYAARANLELVKRVRHVRAGPHTLLPHTQHIVPQALSLG